MKKESQETILLTISILISRCPDTVRKCLDSVKPILETVNSELILTDTGCGKEVREIIEEYTDNIIEFKWCDDFAKARNLGLEKAKGKWFLFLDDDEWFEDTSEITNFFQTGEYKDYGLAVYTVRNYTSIGGEEYKETSAGRMIKLENDIRFQYAIHECFNRIPGKTKILNTFAHHYGYVFKTEEEKKEHSERNIRLLEKEHKKEPGNLKHFIQLIQEYNAIEDYKKSVEIAKKGISYTSTDITSHNYYQSLLCANVVNCYFWQQDFEKVIEYGNQYLAMKNIDLMTRVALYHRMAMTYYKMQKYSFVLEFSELYQNGYKELKKNKNLIFATNIISWIMEKDNYEKIIYIAVQTFLIMQEYEKAVQWLYELEDKKLAIYIGNWKECVEQKKYSDAFDCLKVVQTEISDWDQLIQYCLKETKKRIEIEKKEKNEFYQLGLILKKKARESIISGQLEIAKEILIKLKEIMPEDEEIEIMLQSI